MNSTPLIEAVAAATTTMINPSENAGFWDRITDERVNEFYLLRGGPSIILSIVAVYLYFVLSLGPKLMAKHEPFRLNKLLLLYNVGMAAANLWLFIQGLLVSNFGLDTLGCGKFGGDIRQSPRRGIFLGYLFFLTKLVELLDTVFFILRKKSEQVTFLHVFHHSIVPCFCWIGIKLAPGGPNGFFPLINSFIHVIMYSYYALTTFGPRVEPYLWWKKYLTRLQMIQFVLVMINAAKTSMSQDCKFPILFSYLQAAVATAFLILFAMFYKNAYQQQKQKRSIKQQRKDQTVQLSSSSRANNNDHNELKLERKKLDDVTNNNILLRTTTSSSSTSKSMATAASSNSSLGFNADVVCVKSDSVVANRVSNGVQQKKSNSNVKLL